MRFLEIRELLKTTAIPARQESLYQQTPAILQSEEKQDPRMLLIVFVMVWFFLKHCSPSRFLFILYTPFPPSRSLCYAPFGYISSIAYAWRSWIFNSFSLRLKIPLTVFCWLNWSATAGNKPIYIYNFALSCVVDIKNKHLDDIAKGGNCVILYNVYSLKYMSKL